MAALPGLTWEYIAFNMDLYRLTHLSVEWQLRQNQAATLRSMENMLEQLGGFTRRKKVKKNKLDEGGEMVSLDPAKWTVVSHTRL